MRTVSVTRYREEDAPTWEFFNFTDGKYEITTGDCEQAGLWSFDGGSMLASELLQLRAFLNNPIVLTTLRRDAAAERVSAARSLGLKRRAHMRRRIRPTPRRVR